MFLGRDGADRKAFLRIRPTPSDYEITQVRPYLEMQGDKDVLMRAPIVSYSSHLGRQADN
jgi:hypothetical protein